MSNSSKQTLKELIQSLYSSPLIGAACSQAAEELCLRNNLTFVQLINPFSKISSEAHFRDNNAGASVSVRGLRLNICDVDYRPPQTLLARKMLNDSVSNITESNEKLKEITLPNDSQIQIPSSHPWYEEWRGVFFSVQFPSDHEFTRHLLGCLIVVSSTEANPIEQANQLTKKVKMMQNITPPKLPKWISANSDDALNCYIMLHDHSLSGDISKAQQHFENLKATFGDNRCFLIQINSLKEPNVNQNDLWIKFIKNFQKTDQEVDSLPKTPIGIQGISQMPSTIQIETPQTSFPSTHHEINHPLSPLQESLPDMMPPPQTVTLSMSTSTNSLTDQIPSTTINPNVWANEPTELNVNHGAWLSSSDLDNLRHFVQDFAVRALIPYVEKMVGQLSESITNKKSVSKSLLGATKRWFNTNKPGVAPQNAVIYTSDSIELQTRKLGDLYFMFGNYNLAFQAYHQAKRDFYADSAWQFYAGSLEMAALAAFMQGTANRKTYDYMEEAISTYLNVCRLPQFATRATILSIECLKAANFFIDAAKQLTRMSSEDADLRSALLLEQAAYCYLLEGFGSEEKNNTSYQLPFYRKYAFHSVLSGHRFTKAGQRKHAFRMYRQAEQVISQRGWNLAEDHIEYTISKQAIALKKLEEAKDCLAHLLRPSSLQSSQQQLGFLREYIATIKAIISQTNSEELMAISLPCLNQTSVRVLVTSTSPEVNGNEIPASNIDINDNLSENWMWNKLEEMVVQSATQKPLMIFKPSQSLFSGEFPTSEHPLSTLNEPIHVAFVLENPIKPSILFENVTLLWEFKKESGEMFSNRAFFKNDGHSVDESIVKSTMIDVIEFGEYEKKMINMKITTAFTGYLRIIGIVGKVSSVLDKIKIWSKINFDKIFLKSDGKDYDRKLEIQILPPATALHVRVTEFPKEMVAGEILEASMEIKNVGKYPISDIFMSFDSPKELIIDYEGKNDTMPLSIEKDFRDITNETFNKDKEARKQFVKKILDRQNANDLQPDQTRRIKFFVQAPHKKGKKSIKLLLYYNVPETYPKIKYRLIRHEIFLNVDECLAIEANCNVANQISEEIGLDIIIKNTNQTHHLYNINLTLGDLFIFCDKFSLDFKRVFFISNKMSTESKVSSELQSNESLSLRCILDTKENKEVENTSLWDRLRNKLSKNCIQNIDELQHEIYQMQFSENFLVRHEAHFFPFSKTNITNEDLNTILSLKNRHMTMCLNWKASISENGSFVRNAFGQHFVQLESLFESYCCPPRSREMKTFGAHEQSFSIYDFKQYLEKHVKFNEFEEWFENSRIVNYRCFLEPTEI